jgi:hypothetical protein
MSTDRALVLSIASFVLFAAFVVVLFAMLDLAPALSIGPIIALAIASVGVYRAARDDEA